MLTGKSMLHCYDLVSHTVSTTYDMQRFPLGFLTTMEL